MNRIARVVSRNVDHLSKLLFTLLAGASSVTLAVPLGTPNTCLFTANSADNTVSAMQVSADGTLTEAPDSPFATGGQLTQGVVTHPRSLLFAVNTNSNNISQFTINPSTCGHLLASALTSQAILWTFDRHLAAAATKLGLLHR